MAKTKRRATAHNSVLNFLSNYKHPFTIDPAFIDCTDMSKNYKDGLIPLVDLAAAVDATVGQWQGRINQYPGLVNLKPYFTNVDVKHVYSHPAFNRDTSPNHCSKLERDWFEQFATVGLGLKLPTKYGDIILNADTTHTGISRIRQGETTLPFWLADVPDQGSFETTFNLALLMAGHLFLAINVRNKRGVDVFDQHNIKVATGIYPAPQIQNIVNNTRGVVIKRAGNKIPGAIHNLNETYMTFELDRTTPNPGKLLETSLKWQVRNFRHQSIDGCLLTSFAMLMQENADIGINWTQAQQDALATELINRFNTSNAAQLGIKKACLLLNKNRPGFVALDNNYVVSNGLSHIANTIKLRSMPDQLAGNWEVGF